MDSQPYVFMVSRKKGTAAVRICRHMTLKFYSTPRCSFSLCEKIQMRTTCSITKTCVVAHKRRNCCYWGNLKFPHAMLSPVSAHLRAKEKKNVDNEKLTISHTFCSSHSIFPALSLENFPTDTARGNRSAAPTSENFPRTTSNTFSDRSDLIRSVCLRDLSTQHH